MSNVAIPARPGFGGSGPGRPRHTGRGGHEPREEILSAAGRLFVDRGFAATSTREIAEAVGIRQASLYYHFSGKDEILGQLLDHTVRPTVERIAKIEEFSSCPWTRLYLLVALDVRTLLATEHNTAFLARLPDVTRSPAFDGYEQVRRELTDAYDRLGRDVEALSPGLEPSPLHLGHQLLQLVEVVIVFRRTKTRVDAAGIAASCLRVCGASTLQIALAAATANELLQEHKDVWLQELPRSS